MNKHEGVDFINIFESPHCELFEFTKLLNSKQAELIPEGYTNRCIYDKSFNNPI